jgi:hypothetical protein
MPQQQMQGQMQGNPMFSPGPQYAPLPGQNGHMGGPQQPNGSELFLLVMVIVLIKSSAYVLPEWYTSWASFPSAV